MTATASRRLSRRLALVGTATAAVGGLIASAGLVWNASYSAFSAQTTTPQNNWTAGTVALTNNKTGSALFNWGPGRPGLSSGNCLTVTSSGNLPAVVKLYTTAGTYSTGNNMAAALRITIRQGSLTTAGDCSSFVPDGTGGNIYTGAVTVANIANFASTATNYGNALGSWTTTGGASETKVYKFDFSLDPVGLGWTQAQVDTLQGQNTQIGFTWEAQNT